MSFDEEDGGWDVAMATAEINRLQARNAELQEAVDDTMCRDTYLGRVQTENVRLRNELHSLREALTPSAETKGVYIGEFTTWGCDECGDVTIEWTATKEIMRAIRDEAAHILDTNME